MCCDCASAGAGLLGATVGRGGREVDAVWRASVWVLCVLLSCVSLSVVVRGGPVCGFVRREKPRGYGKCCSRERSRRRFYNYPLEKLKDSDDEAGDGAVGAANTAGGLSEGLAMVWGCD